MKRRREIFVFTAEEKKVVACLIAALVLGLATRQFRGLNPRPAPRPTAQEQRAAKIAQREAAAKDRTLRTAKAARLTPAPVENDDD